MAVSRFGRELETWETDSQEFCHRGDIPVDSDLGMAIARLSPDEMHTLSQAVDPAFDFLGWVDERGFDVYRNGRRIKYEF